MFGLLGHWEIAGILLIVFILFGAGKLPQVFESFGKAMKSFRDAQSDGELETDAPGTLEDAKEVSKS